MLQATLLGYNLGHYTNYRLQQDATMNAIVKLQHYAGSGTLCQRFCHVTTSSRKL
jgi:hypothetical protein